MNPIIQFIVLSIPIIFFSRRNILHPKSHGFFRFFGWANTIAIAISCVKPTAVNELRAKISIYPNLASNQIFVQNTSE